MCCLATCEPSFETMKYKLQKFPPFSPEEPQPQLHNLPSHRCLSTDLAEECSNLVWAFALLTFRHNALLQARLPRCWGGGQGSHATLMFIKPNFQIHINTGWQNTFFWHVTWVYLKTHLNTFDTKPSSYVWKFVLQHLKKAPAPSHAGLEHSFPRNCFRYLDFGASNVTISMVNRMGSQIQDISIESLSHFVLISCALNLDRWLDTNGLWLATLSWYRRCVLLIWLSLERKWNDIWCNCKFQNHKFWALTEVWSVIMPSVDILYQSTLRVVTSIDASPNAQLWCKHWLTIHFTFKHTLFQKRNVNLLLLCCSTRHSGLEDHIYVYEHERR